MLNIITLQTKYMPLLEQNWQTFFATQNIPKVLHESMLYSLQTGGKRLRPLLVFVILQAYGKDPLIGIEVASAIEMIHTYSLIHDDLPAMDNDDFRRGKPTNHKVYGEGIAVLAGDALQVAAFAIIVNASTIKSTVKLEIINKLMQASGASGMIAGQALDISSAGKCLTLAELQEMHALKTGQLIEVCASTAAQLIELDALEAKKLQKLGYYLGLAFQIQDDILDEAEVKDTEQKCTYPSLLTMAGAERELHKCRQLMEEIVSNLNCDQELLRELISLFLKRKY